MHATRIISRTTFQTYKVTITYVVPPIIIFLAKSPLVGKYDLSSLRVIFYGAAPGSKDVIKIAKSRTGVGSFRQGYGMVNFVVSVSLRTCI